MCIGSPVQPSGSTSAKARARGWAEEQRPDMLLVGVVKQKPNVASIPPLDGMTRCSRRWAMLVFSAATMRRRRSTK